MEEFMISVKEEHLEVFGTFFAQAAGNEDKLVQMDVFIVKELEGKPTPDNEVEEILWLSSNIPQGIKVGSIFEHEIIPKLKVAGLID